MWVDDHELYGVIIIHLKRFSETDRKRKPQQQQQQQEEEMKKNYKCCKCYFSHNNITIYNYIFLFLIYSLSSIETS
jgi:hypothetical protein